MQVNEHGDVRQQEKADSQICKAQPQQELAWRRPALGVYGAVKVVRANPRTAHMEPPERGLYGLHSAL